MDTSSAAPCSQRLSKRTVDNNIDDIDMEMPATKFRNFLKLPRAVQTRICELAVLNHDRGAVYLPRKLPRKVTPETDHGVAYVYTDEQVKGLYAHSVVVEPAGPEASAACGRWSDGGRKVSTITRIVAATAAELATYDDDQVSNAEAAGSETGAVGKDPAAPPANCPNGENCTYDKCVVCVKPAPIARIRSNNLITQDFLLRDDRNDVDEDEQFDRDEEIGMLYEPREPGILRASSEIRKLALPLYYAGNAFSWRFFWQDYTRSLQRFNDWVDVVGAENARLIKQLGFEGRHAVEEGVDFDVDIDILGKSPGFRVGVSCRHGGDQATERIQKTLRGEYLSKMHAMLDRLEEAASEKRESGKGVVTSTDKAKRPGQEGGIVPTAREADKPESETGIVLTTDDIKELGDLFVTGMHTDAGNYCCI